MKRIYQYLILGILATFLLYGSVYFEPLNEVLAEREAAAFDPVSYANTAWDKLMENTDQEAIMVEALWAELGTNPAQACEKHGKVLGISNKCFFLLQGEGTILAIDEESVLIENPDQGIQVRIAIQFVFGNAIRDASGQVPVSDFASIMDFNRVAEEMNKKVREEVVPPFLARASVGMLVRFVVAASVRKDQAFGPPLEVIPISLTLQ